MICDAFDVPPSDRPLFSRDLLEDVDLQITVRHLLLQAAGFLLDLAHAFDVGRFQAAKVLPPALDRLGADAVLVRHVRDRLGVGLPEDRDHLLVGESRLLHGPLVASRVPLSQASAGPKIARQVIVNLSESRRRSP